MLDWAKRHSYGVRDLFGGEITPALYDACVDRYYWDYFLCPEENRDLATRLESNGEKLLNGDRYVCRKLSGPGPQLLAHVAYSHHLRARWHDDLSGS